VGKTRSLSIFTKETVVKKSYTVHDQVYSICPEDISSDLPLQGQFAESSASVSPAFNAVSALRPILYLKEPADTNAISINDIHQGQLDDCFLLSSIGEIVRQSPAFISNMIHVNSNGTETLRLYGAASGSLPTWGTTSYKPIFETVTNTFSTTGVNSGATQDVVGNQKEIWPQVIEKAVAQLDGGYQAISAGGSPVIAMEELTGHAATFMAPAQLTLATLSSLVAAHDLITMLTPHTGVLPNGLLNGHAYMFEGTSGSGTATSVNLGNPWGYDQPKPLLLSQLSHGITEVEVGHLA
jgi:hypothetical protein